MQFQKESKPPCEWHGRFANFFQGKTLLQQYKLNRLSFQLIVKVNWYQSISPYLRLENCFGPSATGVLVTEQKDMLWDKLSLLE